jgi:hypothetical protein
MEDLDDIERKNKTLPRYYSTGDNSKQLMSFLFSLKIMITIRTLGS